MTEMEMNVPSKIILSQMERFHHNNLYVRTNYMENRSEHPIKVNDSTQDDKQEILGNDTKDVNENKAYGSETCTQETGIL
jgi:hypothetical protein